MEWEVESSVQGRRRHSGERVGHSVTKEAEAGAHQRNPRGVRTPVCQRGGKHRRWVGDMRRTNSKDAWMQVSNWSAGQN